MHAPKWEFGVCVRVGERKVVQVPQGFVRDPVVEFPGTVSVERPLNLDVAVQIDGLKQVWDCRTLFLNPPYSRTLLPAFAKKFHEEWMSLRIKEHAIVLINNATETAAFDLFSQCAILRAEPRKRIQFVSTQGRSVQGNPRGQVFFYCGVSRCDRFTQVFSEAGCRIMGEVK